MIYLNYIFFISEIIIYKYKIIYFLSEKNYKFSFIKFVIISIFYDIINLFCKKNNLIIIKFEIKNILFYDSENYIIVILYKIQKVVINLKSYNCKISNLHEN